MHVADETRAPSSRQRARGGEADAGAGRRRDQHGLARQQVAAGADRVAPARVLMCRTPSSAAGAALAALRPPRPPRVVPSARYLSICGPSLQPSVDHDLAALELEHAAGDQRATRLLPSHTTVGAMLSGSCTSKPAARASHLFGERLLGHARARRRGQRVGGDAVAPQLRGLHQREAGDAGLWPPSRRSARCCR